MIKNLCINIDGSIEVEAMEGSVVDVGADLMCFTLTVTQGLKGSLKENGIGMYEGSFGIKLLEELLLNSVKAGIAIGLYDEDGKMEIEDAINKLSTENTPQGAFKEVLSDIMKMVEGDPDKDRPVC